MTERLLLCRSLISLLFVLVPLEYASSQQRLISGTVTEAGGGIPLPGASVVIQNTSTGVSTDFDGNFSIQAETGDVLVVSYIGFQDQVVVVSEADNYSVFLILDSELDEVVLTGVAGKTDLRKVSFSVGKVSEEILQQVPAVNAANALRGKVAGVTVVQGTGLPGVASNIRIRGGSSLTGSQAPLILLDGVILDGSLADIPSEDIQEIEVLKGSAAASFYGSRAANGVVQIFTKRGSSKLGASIRIRGEYGNTYIPEARLPSIAQHHYYKLDASGNFELGVDGAYAIDEDGIIDNPFPVYYDNLSSFFVPQNTHTQNVSLSSRSENSRSYISFTNLSQSGILDFDHFGYDRQSLRVNHDISISDRLELSTSTFISASTGNEPALGAGSPFYTLLFTPPHADLSAPNDEDGSPYNWNAQRETGWPSNETNALYTLNNEIFENRRQRVTGNYKLSYDLTNYLNLEGAYSLDYITTDFDFFVDKGWLDTENSTYANGYIQRNRFKSRKDNFQVTLSFDKNVNEDLNVKAKLSYFYDDRHTHSVFAQGSSIGITGLNDLNNVVADEEGVGSSKFDFVEKSYSGLLALDIKDRYIIDFLLRRDGNSLFGPDVREQNFYRISGAYRLNEDFDIPGIEELKLRASYGTAGLLPPFAAQYETYDVSQGKASKSTIGNKGLGPFYSAELEIGTNIQVGPSIFFEYNYAEKATEGQVLPVDIPVEIGGFPFQWRNAGTLTSFTNEFALTVNWLNQESLFLDTTLSFQSTNQFISKLEKPEYQIGPSNAFIIEEGKNFGTFQGSKVLTSLDELAPSQDPAKHAINDEGYVINTDTGNPVFLLDENGNQAEVPIGDINPDFQLALNSTLRIGNFSAYVLWDWKHGGNVYTQTKQWTYRELLHSEVDQSGKPEAQKKKAGYYSTLYNVNNTTSHFVEDASYLKLRELNLSYTVKNVIFLNKTGSIKVSLIGRNILQIDNYSGVDPEVTVPGNGDQTNFFFDGFGYPTYTTLTGGLEFNF